MISSEKVIHELEVYIYKELVQCYTEKTALACVDAMLNCLYLNFRSQLMYIPSCDRSSSEVFNNEIYRHFTGHNHKELAIKFNRSEQNIYTIVNKMRLKDVRKCQVDLFPIPTEEKDKPATIKVIEDYLPIDLFKCGISENDAIHITKKISLFLCQKYPGISIVISKKLQKKRVNKDQLNLF